MVAVREIVEESVGNVFRQPGWLETGIQSGVDPLSDFEKLDLALLELDEDNFHEERLETFAADKFDVTEVLDGGRSHFVLFFRGDVLLILAQKSFNMRQFHVLHYNAPNPITN